MMDERCHPQIGWGLGGGSGSCPGVRQKLMLLVTGDRPGGTGAAW